MHYYLCFCLWAIGQSVRVIQLASTLRQQHGQTGRERSEKREVESERKVGEVEKNNKLRHSDSKQTLKMHNTPKLANPKRTDPPRPASTRPDRIAWPWRPRTAHTQCTHTLAGNTSVLCAVLFSGDWEQQFACLTWPCAFRPYRPRPTRRDETRRDVSANHDKHTHSRDVLVLPHTLCNTLSVPTVQHSFPSHTFYNTLSQRLQNFVIALQCFNTQIETLCLAKRCKIYEMCEYILHLL